MTQKVFNLVKGCVEAAEVAAVAVVTYCVEDKSIAAGVNAGIIALGEAALLICKAFVKE